MNGDDSTYYVNKNKEIVDEFIGHDLTYSLAVGTYLHYTKNLYQDFYIGFGQGSSSAISELNLLSFPSVSLDLVAFQSNYSNVFLQSLFIIDLGDFVDLSLNSRFNFLTFHSFDYIFDEGYFDRANDYSKESVEDFFKSRKHLATQLGVTVNFRLEYIRLFTQFQIGMSRNRLKDHFAVRPVSLYAGFSLPISQFWKKD